MNSVNSRVAKLCIKGFILFGFISSALAWEIDFSRRQVDFNQVNNQSRLPANVKQEETAKLLHRALEAVEPAQDIVIMNTDKGFVPETLHLRQGGNYRIHVVNVNGKEKNVSFVLDAFSEHHNTVFGQARTFSVSPKVEGVFSYQCPETSAQGKFVIYSDMKEERKPASR